MTEPKKYAFKQREEKDPCAMDIDRVDTFEERTEHMKKGLCFNCHKQGHMARECPDKKTGPIVLRTMNPNYRKPEPMKDALKRIQAIHENLSHEEQNELMNNLENEGF
jgi:hypothetical protein